MVFAYYVWMDCRPRRSVTKYFYFTGAVKSVLPIRTNYSSTLNSFSLSITRPRIIPTFKSVQPFNYLEIDSCTCSCVCFRFYFVSKTLPRVLVIYMLGNLYLYLVEFHAVTSTWRRLLGYLIVSEKLSIPSQLRASFAWWLSVFIDSSSIRIWKKAISFRLIIAKQFQSTLRSVSWTLYVVNAYENRSNHLSRGFVHFNSWRNRTWGDITYIEVLVPFCKEVNWKCSENMKIALAVGCECIQCDVNSPLPKPKSPIDLSQVIVLLACIYFCDRSHTSSLTQQLLRTSRSITPQVL